MNIIACIRNYDQLINDTMHDDVMLAINKTLILTDKVVAVCLKIARLKIHQVLNSQLEIQKE